MSTEQIELLRIVFSFSLTLDSILMALVIFLSGFVLRIELAKAVRQEIREQAPYVFALLWLSLALSALSFSGFMIRAPSIYYSSIVLSCILIVFVLLYSVLLFRKIRGAGKNR